MVPRIRLTLFFQTGILPLYRVSARTIHVFPLLSRKQVLVAKPFYCSHKLSKTCFSTGIPLFKKLDEANTDQTKEKLPSKDDKTVQVFDQKGLFVGKMKFWKAKANAHKNRLRLVEMKNSVKSKKNKSAETEEESQTNSDIPSYKLVARDEFHEALTEQKIVNVKDVLKQIILKSNIDKSGIDIKMIQIRKYLLKKGKLKIQIQLNNSKSTREDLVSVFKKLHEELTDISTVHELSSTATKITALVTAKDSFIKSHDSEEVGEKK